MDQKTEEVLTRITNKLKKFLNCKHCKHLIRDHGICSTGICDLRGTIIHDLDPACQYLEVKDK